MMRYINHFLWYLGLILLQVLILNNTHFLGVFLPIVYIYALLRWPPDTSPSLVILLGFLLGFSVDVLTNTPGMNASATTLIAFLRYPTLRLFVSKDDLGSRDIGEYTLANGAFWKYVILLVLIHHNTLFILEAFSFSNTLLLLLKIPICSLLTLVFIFAFERINGKKDARN
ncbi:MAG TPA: rod shape-determining protein MreD [Bacteroidales bacterium]|nr:rod shape-determining protein MreD [Bacteroidales bacterium]